MPTGADAIWQWVWRAAPIGLVFLAGFLAIRYMTGMPGRSYQGVLEPLPEHELALRDQPKAHIVMLAGTIGERNLLRYQALNAAAGYISQQFQEMGYTVREQIFVVEGKTVKNLEAELPGKSHPKEIILFGAHYDSVIGSPGANDNATGVAALLALARFAKEYRFGRTLRFVAFVNEEPPYFQGPGMGSRVYARECAQRGDRIAAMVSLETIGYYSDRDGSQSYPFPFSFFYPKTGNFVAFVGNLASRDLVRRIVAGFRKHTRFPSEGVAAPGVIPGISWSDQWPFWEEGYPAVMVTDTAFHRYGQYHTLRDTPEIIDYERLARVIAGLGHVLGELASLERH